MGIHPEEPKTCNFLRKVALAYSMHKNVHRKAHGHFWVMEPERQKVEEFLYLLVFLESWKLKIPYIGQVRKRG